MPTVSAESSEVYRPRGPVIAGELHLLDPAVDRVEIGLRGDRRAYRCGTKSSRRRCWWRRPGSAYGSVGTLCTLSETGPEPLVMFWPPVTCHMSRLLALVLLPLAS